MTAHENERHLDLLATFHYVVGGIGILFACIPLIHLLVGAGLLLGLFPFDDQDNIPPAFVGMLFAVVGGLFFLLGQALAWCIIYSGAQLKKREKYLFSFVVACIMCIFVPFGTVLGVFTIVVLSKESVKAMYERTY